MTPAERQKAIACAFMRSGWDHGAENEEEVYDRWLITEEGKRLTAEEPEPKESSYDLLVKISGQLDRIEGNMKVELKY